MHASASTLAGWTPTTAFDATDARNRKHNTTLWNTSVEKVKVNGKTLYVMSFDTDIAYWTSRFATSESATGPWSVLDVDKVFIVDPTLRYSESDGYWYCMTGRSRSVLQSSQAVACWS